MIETTRIRIETEGNCQIIDITPEVNGVLNRSKAASGTVTIFVVGSTAGIGTIEFEERLLSDFKGFWSRLAPRDVFYAHNSRWGEANGHSHVQASLLGASLAVPFVDRTPTLGTWQQIVLVDFDVRPRSREIVLQILGE